MMNLAHLIQRYELEGTVVNKFGEGVYLGRPSEVRHRKYEYQLSWAANQTEHNSPFDTLLIHEGRKLFAVLPVTAFRMDDVIKSITVHVR